MATITDRLSVFKNTDAQGTARALFSSGTIFDQALIARLIRDLASAGAKPVKAAAKDGSSFVSYGLIEVTDPKWSVTSGPDGVPVKSLGDYGAVKPAPVPEEVSDLFGSLGI